PLLEYVGEELQRSLEIAIQGARGQSIVEEEDLDKGVEVLKRMQNPKGAPIERSYQVMKRVFNEVYYPFLIEMERVLSKFDELFEEKEWRCFPSKESPYYEGRDIPVTDKFESIIDHLRRSIEFGEISHHNYKAIKLFSRYNSDNPFNLEVASILWFRKNEFKLEFFIGEPYGSTQDLQMLHRAVRSLSEYPDAMGDDDDFKIVPLVERDYRYEVLNEEIHEWAKKVGEETMKAIRVQIANQSE
ncbi:MAG: hypothetical protein ABEH43_09930, partial [Flavobacteriales bacterium]